MNIHWSIYQADRAVDGKSWCAEKLISLDGGKSYYPTYVKEYFYTEAEADLFAEMQGKKYF